MKTLKILTLLAFVSFSFNCSQERDEFPTLIVGNEFINSNTRVIEIDTFQVEISTIKFDSLITSSGTRLLIGQFDDENFGQTKAAAFFELVSQDFFIDFDNNAELDSMGLILGYDGYHYNDTTLITSMSIHRLTERIRPNDITLFNTTDISFDPNAIATYSYRPEPNTDSIYINLPLSFSQGLFNQIQEGEIDDNPSLIQILPGFTLQPSGGPNSPVIGFTSNSERTYLRIFYKIPDELEEEQFYFDLKIDPTSTNTFYNKITSNTASLPISLLTDQEQQLNSSLSGNNSYIQSGVGYATKIEFPSIRRINEIAGSGVVMSATLELYANSDSFNENQKIMDSLAVSVLDQNHVVTEQLTGRLGAVFSFYTIENQEFNNAYYSADITSFVIDKINEAPITENSLIFQPTNFNSSINKVLIHDQNSNENQARLIITYAIYDED